MPPDSDTIEVYIPAFSPDPNYQIADEMELEGEQSPLATPTNQPTQPISFEIPIQLNKRQANFSPEIAYRTRNPFQNNNAAKPVAKNAEQAIYWARDLILQASTMAQTHISQNKILELLDVFRDYTETGRVTNKINDKLSAQLAYHTATLTTASQQATKTLKKAVNAATTPNNLPTQTQQDLISNNQNNQQNSQQNSQQNIQQNRTSYATIAAQNKNSTWTTVPARKKPNKKPTSYYQLGAPRQPELEWSLRHSYRTI
ncbi:hypothetical protein KJE20_13956 [Pyrenophora tritici-repentis]|uniref:Uncharacterized protein n=1 Tax=Pyrenophora tritici-repentis TaxID=45151 RepID=A0A922NDE4_9PLEO|nr:hypothetical protein Ptr86124_014057 [Pyrenophora tritici-repentis]KAI1507614.1 hypothetical protein Ptr86124_013471 [Pyrenophora tritici-repentis]KAI1513891.1 hypothetical protein Ptr86124_006521 [Pyrenophora tritici-repentis]KAI1676444.1 hypothetical protein KJE20_13956 [Pyrenophora tritici-repentis]